MAGAHSRAPHLRLRRRGGDLGLATSGTDPAQSAAVRERRRL